ncbi:unnamed protein product [Ranitomeya imitator]|uniref:Uncharacterized protein n=1 Tax=Ranitomeya imitator TaxID=111125 RepID=A0ABN9KY57_9NEOB|nr:unnamed protein product [Ranitomeya imitator]
MKFSSGLHAAAPAQAYFVCPVEGRAKYCSSQVPGKVREARRLHTVVLCSALKRADKVRLRRSVKTRRGRHLMKMGGTGPRHPSDQTAAGTAPGGGYAINVRDETVTLKKMALTSFQKGSSTKEYFLQGTLNSLERYFYLIAFNFYLHEQYPLAFALSFSRWMCMHPWIYRLQATMNLSELTVSAELITKGTRVLVLDERFSPDVLSTVKEMNVANFRRVPKMAIYGTAQPNSKASSCVLNYLTDPKRKYSNILWVNLREDIIMEGNEQIYTPREQDNFDQHIAIPVNTPEQLEKLEATIVSHILTSQKWLEVCLEQEKQMKMFKTCQTMQEIFNQQRSTYPGLVYKRIPIPDFCAPREQVTGRIYYSAIGRV